MGTTNVSINHGTTKNQPICQSTNEIPVEHYKPAAKLSHPSIFLKHGNMCVIQSRYSRDMKQKYILVDASFFSQNAFHPTITEPAMTRLTLLTSSTLIRSSAAKTALCSWTLELETVRLTVRV